MLKTYQSTVARFRLRPSSGDRRPPGGKQQLPAVARPTRQLPGPMITRQYTATSSPARWRPTRSRQYRRHPASRWASQPAMAISCHCDSAATDKSTQTTGCKSYRGSTWTPLGYFGSPSPLPFLLSYSININDRSTPMVLKFCLCIIVSAFDLLQLPHIFGERSFVVSQYRWHVHRGSGHVCGACCL